MTRFYFDVCDGSNFTPDAMGVELSSIDEAEQEAVLTAVGIGRDCAQQARTPDVVVNVSDEHGFSLIKVVLSLNVERKIRPRVRLQLP